MIGNVTNLLLGQMLLSSRRPNSGGGQQAGQNNRGLAGSERVRTPGDIPLGFKETEPDVDSWRPQQRWSEEHRWWADDEFLPSPLREQEQQRRRLYKQGLEQFRRLMKELEEREREKRLRRGESMIA